MKAVASIVALVLTLGTVACGDAGSIDSQSQAVITSEEIQYIDSLTDAQRAGTLAFVNDVSTTQPRLDYDCGLYSNAATAIIKHRDGVDAVYPSGDDNPFDNMLELAGVVSVGIANLTWVVECADAFGFIRTEEWVLVENADLLDPALAAAIDALIADGNPCDICDPQDPFSNCSPYPVRFADVLIHLVNGEPVDYTLNLVQLLDPEGGIQELIQYQLDASFAVLGLQCSI